MILALLWALLQDPTAVARQHFRDAEAAEKRGDYDTALQEYVAAYDAKPHPAVLYNIATVYERLGDPEEAVHYYDRYLQERPDAPDAASVRARVGQIRMRPSMVTVETQPRGARISVDGVPKCDAPCEIKVSAGGHEVAAQFPGSDLQRKKITAEFGKPIPLAFTNKTRSGRLAVHTTPDGADVVLDGENVGTAPLEIEVAAGRHRVGARMRGYRTNTQMIDIPDGDTAQWTPELIPLGARAGQTPGGGVVAPPPRILPPPGGGENEVHLNPVPRWTYGSVGGPNLLHANNSWGGGFTLGIQGGTQTIDLEMAVLFPVATFEFDLRWYLSTSSFFRPFLVFGTALVAEKSDTMSSSSDTTPVFYTLNGGGGFALDFGIGAFYVEGLANVIVTESVPERFSVPLLAGIYFRSGR